MSGLLDKHAFLRRIHMPHRRMSAVYLALVGIILSFLVFGVVRRMEYRRIQADLDRAGETNLAALTHGLDTHLLKLESLAAFHAGSEEVTRDEFREFVQPILRRRVGVQALGWVPRVPYSLREEYEAEARRESFKDFVVTEMAENGKLVPASQRNEYFPVYFVEPYEGNQVALGFDLCSEAKRRQALEHARATGRTTVTSRIRIVQEKDGQYGFLMVYPVYQKGVAIATLRQRRENLEGFYVTVSHAGELLEHLWARQPKRGIDTHIFDASAPEGEQLLYFHPARTRKVPISPTYRHITKWSGFFHEATVEVGGREWLILTTPAPGFIAARRDWESWAALGTGIVFTILLTAYVSFILAAAKRAREYAAEQGRFRQQLQREIAVRKRAQKQREQLVDALRDKNEEMTGLLYAVSHDLRAPLLNIQGFSAELALECVNTLETLKKTKVDGNAETFISEFLAHRIMPSINFISTAGEKMDKLLDGLNRLSKTGRVELKIRPLDMDRVMKTVVDSMSFQIREAGACVTVEQLPLCLGDEGQVNQVFSNLLNNALKYLAPDRPGHITVSGRTENDTSIYCVRDNGIGIPPDHHARIFDIFHRVDPRSPAAGEGLGLTTVKQILTRHNGRIWLESEEGKGSAFFVALPRPDTAGG